MIKRITACAALTLLAMAGLRGAALSADEGLPLIRVGHVGHDHQLALYVAADAGPALDKAYGVSFRELKAQEVYDLYDNGKPVARVHLVRVGGGSKMPAALEQGHIDVGLGGIGPVAKFIDKGAPIKVLAPLNNDGDALVVRNAFPAASWKEFIQAIRSSPVPVRIGYKDPLANAFFIITSALRDEGIRLGQEAAGPDGRPVQALLVNLQGEENTISSLEAGIVDAAVVNEPSPSIVVHKGAGRRVTDLADIPPARKWSGHPCCVVAATEAVLKAQPQAVRSLLKAIAAGADVMAREREKGLDAQKNWTRTRPEVGRESLLHITYVVVPDDAWLGGVDRWIDTLAGGGHFQQRFKGKPAVEVRNAVLELGPIRAALAELKGKDASFRGQ
jgi:NitT/TauT family transport system substrate-binding protein